MRVGLVRGFEGGDKLDLYFLFAALDGIVFEEFDTAVVGEEEFLAREGFGRGLSGGG